MTNYIVIWSNFVLPTCNWFRIILSGKITLVTRTKLSTDFWDVLVIKVCSVNRISAFFSCIDGTVIVSWMAFSNVAVIQYYTKDNCFLVYLVFFVWLNVLWWVFKPLKPILPNSKVAHFTDVLSPVFLKLLEDISANFS